MVWDSKVVMQTINTVKQVFLINEIVYSKKIVHGLMEIKYAVFLILFRFLGQQLSF